jgi:hypothetical protein
MPLIVGQDSKSLGYASFNELDVGQGFQLARRTDASAPDQFVDPRETAAAFAGVVWHFARRADYSLGAAMVTAAGNLVQDAKSSGLTFEELKVLEPLVQRSLAEAKQEILGGKLSPAQRQTMQDSLASFAKAVAPDLPLGRSYFGAAEMLQSIPGMELSGTVRSPSAMLDQWGSEAEVLANLNTRSDL